MNSDAVGRSSSSDGALGQKKKQNNGFEFDATETLERLWSVLGEKNRFENAVLAFE